MLLAEARGLIIIFTKNLLLPYLYPTLMRDDNWVQKSIFITWPFVGAASREIRVRSQVQQSKVLIKAQSMKTGVWNVLCSCFRTDINLSDYEMTNTCRLLQ